MRLVRKELATVKEFLERVDSDDARLMKQCIDDVVGTCERRGM